MAKAKPDPRPFESVEAAAAWLKKNPRAWRVLFLYQRAFALQSECAAALKLGELQFSLVYQAAMLDRTL